MTSNVSAVIYCRVSTKRQVDNLSLDEQEARCRAYCSGKGWTVDRVFIEAGASAKTADRPQFNALIEYVTNSRSRVRYLVVYDASRFMRKVCVLPLHEVLARQRTEWSDGRAIHSFVEAPNSATEIHAAVQCRS